MKTRPILASLIFISFFSSAQNSDNISCTLIRQFVQDKNVLNLMDIGINSNDTITILDSCRAFKYCSSFKSKNHTVIFESDMRSLNLNPDFRNPLEIKKWRNHILIYKYEYTGNYSKVYLFYKPTNTNGFVKYNLDKQKIISIQYRLGQL